MKERIQKLAQGDITSPVEILQTGDEAEDLSIALQYTVQDIRTYIMELRETLMSVSKGNLNVSVKEDFVGDFVILKESTNYIIDSLNNMMQNLQLAANTLSNAAIHVSNDARDVQNASEEQSTSVEKLIQESNEISNSIIEVDEKQKIINLLPKGEKRNKWYGNLVNAALYMIQSDVIQRLDKAQRLDFERDILLEMIKKSAPVFGYRSTEYVKDVGTEERLYSIEKDIRSGLIEKRNLRNRQKCIFLDRDGTLTKAGGLIDSEEKLEVMDCAVNAIRNINASEYLAILVTNQPVVARGMCTLEDVKCIHKKLETLLGEKEVYLDDIIFCPHHPDKGFPEENPMYKVKCKCRKPETGMMEEMKNRYNISLEESWIVGDTTIDIMTGKNAGVRTALVLTGESGKDGKYNVLPDIIGQDIECAVRQIIGAG